MFLWALNCLSIALLVASNSLVNDSFISLVFVLRSSCLLVKRSRVDSLSIFCIVVSYVLFYLRSFRSPVSSYYCFVVVRIALREWNRLLVFQVAFILLISDEFYGCCFFNCNSSWGDVRLLLFLLSVFMSLLFDLCRVPLFSFFH